MKSIFKKYAKLLLISGSALIFSGSAFAAKTHLTMGMSLEPPHLDPTAGAAAADRRLEDGRYRLKLR